MPPTELRFAARVRRLAGTAVALLLALIAMVTAMGAVKGRPPAGPSSGRSVAESPPASAGEGPSWADLTSSQQATLQPLMSTWSRFDAGRKQRWLMTATKLTKLSKQEQARAASRMTAWAGLTMAQRTRIRAQFICAKRRQRAGNQRSLGAVALLDKVWEKSRPLSIVGPAAIQAGAGATTLMLSRDLKVMEAICPPAALG